MFLPPWKKLALHRLSSLALAGSQSRRRKTLNNKPKWKWGVNIEKNHVISVGSGCLWWHCTTDCHVALLTPWFCGGLIIYQQKESTFVTVVMYTYTVYL